jgi:hypothetical protein
MNRLRMRVILPKVRQADMTIIWSRNSPLLRAALPAIVLVLCALAWSGCSKKSSNPPVPAAGEGYSAVLLANGSVYFGKLEGLGSPYPVLHDVYYVQSATDPETKKVTSVLVKRGKEWHAPDRMIINDKAIVFVEPVGADSKVAELIAESKK